MQYRERLCVEASHHTHTAFDIEEIIDNFDSKLFSKITNSGHCLHHLFPPKTSQHCSYSLRKRNIITSCLTLNSRCIKTVLSIDACLSLYDNTLCVL